MSYTRVNWEDAPSEKTPLDAEHLNVMDEGIKKLDEEKLDNTGDIAATKATFEESEELVELTSGAKTATILGIIAKAIGSIISHLKDNVVHIKSTERTNWDTAYDAKHEHSNKSTLDNTTAAYTLEEKSKLEGIEKGAQVNSITGVKGGAETKYRTGNVNLTAANVGAAEENHDQAASTITEGTFGGKVQANATAMATLTDAQVRDSVILETDPGEGATVSYNPGTIVWTK